MANGLYVVIRQGDPTTWSSAQRVDIVGEPATLVLKKTGSGWIAVTVASLLAPDIVLCIPSPSPFPLRWQAAPWGVA